MRVLISIFAVIALVILVLVVRFDAGHVYASRFRVGTFTYHNPTRQFSFPADDVVFRGLHDAMSHSKFDPALWGLRPWGNPEHPYLRLETNARTISALVDLMNRSFPYSLYVRVQLQPTNNGLEYEIYRSE
jgi:hypothetical protein